MTAPTIAAATKIARKLAAGAYGYDQGQRWSALGADGKLKASGELDCSSSTGLIYYLAGFIDRSVLSGTFYTGNLAAKLVATGMFRAIPVKGWSLAKLKAAVKEGDAVVGPGHVVYSVGGGRVLSFENDERGKSFGGRMGDQTGSEGRIRALYARSRGWAYIVRPLSPQELQRRVLDARRTNADVTGPLKRLTRRSPWDGPRWARFCEQWIAWERGMQLVTDPAKLALPPTGKHAFVVLGSGLSDKGTITAKYRRRLALAVTALGLNPDSKVLISGGAPKAGVTEAAAGYAYLIAAGIDKGRIITESRSASTVGNARYSVPILRKLGITSYTLVSDASHLRRASVLFAAAQLGIETTENKVLNLSPTTPLAYNDYAPAKAKTAGPIDATSRATIADEVKALLGL